MLDWTWLHAQALQLAISSTNIDWGFQSKIIIFTQTNITNKGQSSNSITQILALVPAHLWSSSCAAEMHRTLCPVRWPPWWTGSTGLSPPRSQPAACTHHDCLREGAEVEGKKWEVNKSVDCHEIQPYLGLVYHQSLSSRPWSLHLPYRSQNNSVR